MNEVERFTVRLPGGEEFGPASMAMIEQWTRERRVPRNAMLVPADGGEAISVLSRPNLAQILSAVSDATSQSEPDEGVATMIPYRNPPALIGYYISIVSLLPIVGAVAGPAAIRLGVVGLRKRKADPRLHGMAHAWIAIILGLIGTLISIVCIGAIIFAIAAP